MWLIYGKMSERVMNPRFYHRIENYYPVYPFGVPTSCQYVNSSPMSLPRLPQEKSSNGPPLSLKNLSRIVSMPEQRRFASISRTVDSSLSTSPIMARASQQTSSNWHSPGLPPATYPESMTSNVFNQSAFAVRHWHV